MLRFFKGCLSAGVGTPVLMAQLVFGLSQTMVTPSVAGQELQVCVTTPDLADIIRQVGGEDLTVTTFAKGSEDPHELQLRPGFIRRANTADLLVLIGRGVESSWIDDLLEKSGNPKIGEGMPGHLDLGENAGESDEEGDEEHHEEEGEDDEDGDDDGPRDFHHEGNPHYLLDPLEGLRSACEIYKALSAVQPSSADKYKANLQQFAVQLVTELAGSKAAEGLLIDDLLLLKAMNSYEEWFQGRLEAMKPTKPGGLLAKAHTFADMPVVGDHDLWEFFGRRFHLTILGYIEEHPGIPSAAGHLDELIQSMKDNNVRVILKAPYFPNRPVRMVSRATGADTVEMAHQTGASRRAASYLEMISWNVSQISEAVKGN